MLKLWRDDRAFIVSAELTLLATILVIGMVVGAVSVRDQVVQELGDVATAIGNLNQSYSFSGVRACTSHTAGSLFWDRHDYCDCPANGGGLGSGGCGINVYTVPAMHEGVVCPDNPNPGLTDPHLNATL